MQQHRILSGLTILLMVVLVAVGWFLVAQPQLASASAANTQLAGVQSQVTATQASLVQLKGQQKELPTLRAQLAKLRLSLPETADSSAYITGINALAANAGVTISTLKLSAAVLYAPPAAPAAAATGGAATPSPTPSATAAAPSVPTTVPAGWTPTTNGLITSGNFIAIPVEIDTTGSWSATLAFLKGLQSGPRLFLVETLSTAQAADNSDSVLASIGGYIYVLLDPKADALDKANSSTSTPSATPTPTPTPTVSTSPNPSGSSTPTPTTSPTP